MRLRWQVICVLGVLWITNPTKADPNSTTTPSPSLATTTTKSSFPTPPATKEGRESVSYSDQKPEKASPDCQIIIKEMPVPAGSPRAGKLKMECRICRANGYQEECIYIKKREAAGSVSHPMMSDASQQQESIDYSTDPFSQDGGQTPIYEGSASQNHESRHRHSNYKKSPSYDDFDSRLAEVMAGAASIDKEDSEYADYDDEYHGGDSGKKKNKKAIRKFGHDDPSHFETMHSIPKEYLEEDYDPAEYEKHDEAANQFHDYYPGKGHKSAYTGGDEESEDEEETQESGESQQHVLTVLPSMDILKSFLPDVKRIDPDKDVKPKKRKQKVEYVETVRYNSDDDDKTDGESSDKQTSKASPSGNPPPESFFNTDWLKGHETAAYPGHASYHGHASHSYPHHSGQGSHSYPGHAGSSHGAYHHDSDYAPPAMDSKDCKVVYRDAPNGGGKMKCNVCGSPGPKGFSEECSVDYNQPTKAHEVYYNKEQYDHDPYAARKSVYGGGNGNNKKNNAHHGSSSNHNHNHGNNHGHGRNQGYNHGHSPYHHSYHGNGKDDHSHHGSSSNHGDSHHHDPYSSGYGSDDHDDDDYSPTSHHEKKHPVHIKPKYTGPQSSTDNGYAGKIEKDIAAYFGHNVMKFAPFPHDDPYGKAGSSSKDHVSYMPKEDYYLHYFPTYDTDKQ